MLSQHWPVVVLQVNPIGQPTPGLLHRGLQYPAVEALEKAAQ
jgi:hypothetical protein